jgi:hypothetical protein
MANRSTLGTGTTGAGGIINIPLRFWFNNNTTMLIPEVSLPYAAIQININFVTYAGAGGELNFDGGFGPGPGVNSLMNPLRPRFNDDTTMLIPEVILPYTGGSAGPAYIFEENNNSGSGGDILMR